jgi:hypothetical protein
VNRYRNIRGTFEVERDREEAQTHAADVTVNITANLDEDVFPGGFHKQPKGQI